jgi:thiamine biosynthesis protein ThiI
MILVRYGEIGTKSRKTRQWIERRLVENLRRVLPRRRVWREFGRIFIDSGSREDAERASQVFGVVSTSQAVRTSSDLETLVAAGVLYAQERLRPGESFALRVRRTGEQGYTSRDVAVRLGEEIVRRTGARVDLKTPDRTLYIEVRGGDAYLFDEILPGVGGLPLGSQGKALALISGGIDSPVAAYRMMRRGIDPGALFLDPSPLVDQRTSERALQAIQRLAWWKGAPLQTYIVPFGEVLIRLLKAGDPRLGCILCKRMIYRVGGLIARRDDYRALITGESLGQVASQTLENLAAIEEAVDLPVFRPLVGMDKMEIVEEAKRIGTYEVSILPANCCLGPPPHPETRAKIEEVRKAEEELDVGGLAEEMVAQAESRRVPSPGSIEALPPPPPQDR